MKLSQLIFIVFLGFPQPHKVVFNVPALRNKSIIQIKKILGKPKIDDVPTYYQTQAGVTGDAYFVKDGFTLEVTYNPYL